MKQSVFLLYARAANGTIGRDGKLPWHISDDLRRFKALTTDKPMIMGRRTFESLPGLLPGRRHIVLTRDRHWTAEGAEVAHSIDDALRLAGGGEAAIIGGAEIFALFEPLADRVESTEIDADFAGDTFMPPLAPHWIETMREEHPAKGDVPAFAFVTYRRAV